MELVIGDKVRVTAPPHVLLNHDLVPPNFDNRIGRVDGFRLADPRDRDIIVVIDNVFGHWRMHSSSVVRIQGQNSDYVSLLKKEGSQ